jgi:hypothetical protein
VRILTEVTDAAAEDQTDNVFPVAFVTGRLGAPTPLQSWPDDLDPLVTLSRDWQSQGFQAEVWELNGTEENRLFEIAALVASAGEQMGISCMTSFEYLSWFTAPRDNDLRLLQAEFAQRVLAEMTAHYVIGTAHDLMNLTYRALALDTALHPALSKAERLFPPLSDERRHWKTANADEARKARKLARKSSLESVRQVAEPAHALLTSKIWDLLDNCRGEDFHRRRLQTAGLKGAGRTGPWSHQPGQRSMDLRCGQRIGADVPGKLAAETHQVACDARLLLAAAMTEFSERLETARDEVVELRPSRFNRSVETPGL